MRNDTSTSLYHLCLSPLNYNVDPINQATRIPEATMSWRQSENNMKRIHTYLCANDTRSALNNIYVTHNKRQSMFGIRFQCSLLILNLLIVFILCEVGHCSAHYCIILIHLVKNCKIVNSVFVPFLHIGLLGFGTLYYVIS